MKTFEEYSEQAIKTNTRPSPEYPFFGLAEEAGEVMGKISKRIRANNIGASFIVKYSGESANSNEQNTPSVLREDLIKELGDVLWYLNACCVELNVTLEEVAQRNIEKTHDRLNRGVIDGEGDDR